MGEARYDGVAEWYDRTFADSELGRSTRQIVVGLLGDGPGRLLDIGCGGGSHAVGFAERGWTVAGVDISQEQVALAHNRGVDVVKANAEALPFADESFDAAVSMWLHTDVEDFHAVLREAVRVLRPRGHFVYLGVHPCFVGPHSEFREGLGIPQLHPGYRDTAWRTEAPGISPTGVRAKVGAKHLPLGLFLAAFFDVGFRLERFEEPGPREYPYLVAIRARP